jgi:hypothetical protein
VVGEPVFVGVGVGGGQQFAITVVPTNVAPIKLIEFLSIPPKLQDKPITPVVPLKVEIVLIPSQLLALTV